MSRKCKIIDKHIKHLKENQDILQQLYQSRNYTNLIEDLIRIKNDNNE